MEEGSTSIDAISVSSPGDIIFRIQSTDRAELQACSRREMVTIRPGQKVAGAQRRLFMRKRILPLIFASLSVVCMVVSFPARAEGTAGYYRQPALHGETLVFVAEGDLWKVPLAGGLARRLTSHPGDENWPALSSDGSSIAFVAEYEGPMEVYTMPVSGGRPVRRTYGTEAARVVGWTPSGEVLYSTIAFSTLPNWQLVRLDITRDDEAGKVDLVPLAQAADGVYDPSGKRLFFTRLPFQGSHTKRYKGGTAQNLWRFARGDDEAIPLTSDYPGTSKDPMWWRSRLYFASDRDGTMNIWSSDPDGRDLRQHTEHAGWDVKDPVLSEGSVVYQLGADLYVYDIEAGESRVIPVSLESDMDQTREHWVKKPMDYLTSAGISPDGDRVVLTARGQVFVAPHRQGRLVQATGDGGVRHRAARFLPDGKRLVSLSDQSGEVELWSLAANGVGTGEQLTKGGEVLRWEAVPSPDGKWIAHHDKNQRLFIYDVERGVDLKIDESGVWSFSDLAWSPDSRWLAYVAPGENAFTRIRLYDVKEKRTVHATTDRYDSYSPAWSLDGKWLYFLTDRNLRSIVGSPWGSYQPEPYLDKKTLIYQIALKKGLRSPFAPGNELGQKDEEKKNDKSKKGEKDGDKESGGESEDAKPETVIEIDGLGGRLHTVPVPPGNNSAMIINDSALFWRSRPTGAASSALVGAKITNLDLEVKTIVDKIRDYDLSQDGKKILVRKGDELHVFDAKADKASLEKTKVDLSGWQLSIVPREEWRQMFIESWRLERDYFYDRGMHGVDWKAMRSKYLPLVDRLASRNDLSDLMAQMVSELAALHTFVRGSDLREGPDDIQPSYLGALLQRSESAGGYRVEHIYESDPDDLDRRSPLAEANVGMEKGDVIELVNGMPSLSAPDIGMLLRGQAGKQVLLRVQPAGGGPIRDVVVRPLTGRQVRDLRYHQWEYSRRLRVEDLGSGEIGYVHLRAMGGRNFTEWARDYYPVFNRGALIVDVRRNTGGNIDSWIIGRLLRKAWSHWSQRVGNPPSWNMQYAFRGHIAVLCDERTASDGEAFVEAIKRLNIGEVIGTRTWGGEIWLTSSNRLVDNGIATAAEFGVYGPEGEWLIEGHGVEPDVVVDNLPHATFKGQDAQLEAAIQYLKRKMKEEPVPVAEPPRHPDKSFDN
jgi:tricorn protease